MPDKTHKLAAIIFTDIVGYTKQMEENEQQTMQLLQKQREIIFPLVESYGGEVIKEIGDGLLIMFGSAVEAVRFAITAQNRLKDEKLTIRAGIHIGDVIFKDRDVFGSAVNTAARIEPLAPPNGICISEDVRNQLQNKSDIQTISLGIMDLKGVKEPVEIFEVFIEGISDWQKKNIAWFFKDLWSRMVFHILAGYLVSSWIIKQAVSAIAANYLLSPYLVDLAWVILLSLLPTVFLLSYFHGKRKTTKWTNTELVGFPANIAFTLLLVIFLFKGKDLGATTTQLTIENEEGEKIERTVVKSEFRKKIALYNFKNLTNDTAYHWIQYSIPTMVEYDLSQDIYINSRSSVNFFKKLQEAGFEDGIGLPITLMRNIADYYHLNYFFVGDFNLVDGNYTIQTQLYRTKTSKLISENSYTGNNLFNLMDEISVKIKEDLEIPDAHLEESKDLPVAEIFTNSENALKLFTNGYRQIIENDYVKGIHYTEKAVEEDPDFAVAHLALANFYFNSNQSEKSLIALQATMENLYKLPEAIQFFVKFFYYLIRQEADKADAIVNMWVELYPYDTKGRGILAGRYINKGMVHEAIAQYKEILVLDPEEYNYLRRIGGLYEKYGDYNSALIYYQLYADKFPGDFKSYREIGDLFIKTGDIDKAAENFEKALLIESGEVPIMIRLAHINALKGEFEKALETYENIFPACKNAEDSANVYQSLQKYYGTLGQNKIAIEYHENMLDLWKTFRSPKDILVYQVFTISNYIIAGKEERVFQILENITTEFEPPLDKVASFGYLFAYIELEDAEKALKEIKAAEEVIEGFGEQLLMANIHYANGKINEITKEWDKAIEHYQQYEKMQPTHLQVHRWISRCYRNLGDYKDAKKHIEVALKEEPYNPKNNYEAGLLFLDMGDNDKAFEFLQKANEVWKDADEDYKPAQEAKTKLLELGEV